MIVNTLTQFDLSARLGVMGFSIDRVSVSKIESGDRFVPDYEVVAIAKVLEISINWLLTGEKD
ncbi:MAG: helix-turn-helix domain-containing protein [Ruminiclostridium sp.]